MSEKSKATISVIANAVGEKKPGVANSVVNRILDLIRTGNLRAGDRLPSERELIEILDISRPSLREAFRALSLLGVVDTRHGGGAYVTDLEARTLLGPLDFFLSLSQSNLQDTFDARRLVDLEIMRKAALSATPEDIDELEGMIAAHARVQADPIGFRILDSRLHARFSQISNSVVLERIAYGLYNMGLDIRRRATEDLNTIQQSTQDHTRIVAAIAAHNPDLAANEMSAHLDHIEASTKAFLDSEILALTKRTLPPRRK